MKASLSNLPYIKINTTDKMINTNLSSTNDSNNNILNSTFRQSKKLINKIQPYTSNKKEHLRTNLSTSSLTNQTFTYYKDKFLSSFYNDIHKKKFINSLKKNQIKEDLINVINDSQKEAVKINDDIGNDTYVHNFLNKNLSSNRWFKLIPKHLINFREKENNVENVYNKNSKVFKIKKKIVFEKEIVHLSVYDTPCESSMIPVTYCAGKASVIELTEKLGRSLIERGIRVNCISPGPFPAAKVKELEILAQRLKDRSPSKRLGEPDELRGAVLFLASDASKYVVGQNIQVDGGWTLW